MSASQTANRRRALRARRAVVAWRDGEQEDESNLTDLLTDLLHAYAASDFDAALESARSHYASER